LWCSACVGTGLCPVHAERSSAPYRRRGSHRRTAADSPLCVGTGLWGTGVCGGLECGGWIVWGRGSAPSMPSEARLPTATAEATAAPAFDTACKNPRNCFSSAEVSRVIISPRVIINPRKASSRARRFLQPGEGSSVQHPPASAKSSSTVQRSEAPLPTPGKTIPDALGKISGGARVERLRPLFKTALLTNSRRLRHQTLQTPWRRTAIKDEEHPWPRLPRPPTARK
jgi:hypothetical protein